MSVRLHQDDLPAGVSFTGSVAIDTETLGLNPLRDRLCFVQLSAGYGPAHIVQITAGPDGGASASRDCSRIPSVLKIFHFARFDLAVASRSSGCMPSPVYCTKIASRLARTYTDRHGLKDLCKTKYSGVDLSKDQQRSDWGAADADERAARLCRRRCPASS